jgi:hypothetical protein
LSIWDQDIIAQRNGSGNARYSYYLKEMGREMQGIVTTDEAQCYLDMYGQQYKFRVIGIRKDIAE